MLFLKKLTGDVPLFYSKSTTYEMGILINLLVNLCNSHSQEIERMNRKLLSL